jgi:hypothetical protein
MDDRAHARVNLPGFILRHGSLQYNLSIWMPFKKAWLNCNHPRQQIPARNSMNQGQQWANFRLLLAANQGALSPEYLV